MSPANTGGRMPQSQAAAGHPDGYGARGAQGLGREEFARRFQDAAGVLWTVAVAILGDPGRAEDALQEACVIALHKLEQFEPGTSFVAWMAAIVRNVARNDARKGHRRNTRSVEPDVLAEIGPEAEESAPADTLPVDGRGELLGDQQAFDDELDRALAELRPIQRAALLLRTVRGLDYREISAALDIPEGTAMSHVHRARQAMRRRLAALEPEPRRGTPEAGVGGAG